MKWLTPGVKVAWLGDSHTEALGPRLARTLPEATGASFVRAPTARRGWSVRRYVAAGDVGALVRGADVAVVQLGGNDASLGVSADAHARDVASLLGQIRAAGVPKVIWVGPGLTGTAALEAARAPVRQAQAEIVSAAGQVWLDGTRMTTPAGLAPDRVHHTRAGYEHWAAELLAHLKRVPEGGSHGLLWCGALLAVVAGAGFFAWVVTR